MTRIIGVTTNKGGVLKTTLSANIASVLASQNKRTLLIDMDNQANIATTFGENANTYKGNSIYDVLLQEKNINETIVQVGENLDIIHSDERMSYFEMEVTFDFERYTEEFGSIYDILKQKLSELTTDYDYIIIDTPPNLGIVVGNVLKAINEVLIPLHPEPFCVDSLFNTIGAINVFKEKYGATCEILGVVPTKVKKNSGTHNSNLTAVQSVCYTHSLTFTKTKIHESVAPTNAVQNHRLPLMMTKTKSAIKDEFKALVKELGL